MSGPVRDATRAAHRQALRHIAGAPDISAPDAAEQQRLHDAAHIALARLYLGYLNRLFYFAERGGRDEQGRWDELQELIPTEPHPEERS